MEIPCCATKYENVPFCALYGPPALMDCRHRTRVRAVARNSNTQIKTDMTVFALHSVGRIGSGTLLDKEQNATTYIRMVEEPVHRSPGTWT